MAFQAKVLSLSRGGTSANLTASNGGILYSTASAAAILSGTATAGQMLQSGASTTPAWSTATYPATAGTLGNVLKSDGTNIVSFTPAKFACYLNTTLSNVTGDNTAYTVIFDTSLLNQGSAFNLGTSTFTAPIAGTYLFNYGLISAGFAAANVITTTIVCSTAGTFGVGRTSSTTDGNPGINGSLYVNLVLNETVNLVYNVAGGAKVVGLLGVTGGVKYCWFSGSYIY